MARGSVAKENVAKKLQETFGSDFLGEYDKKYYVWADDGDEKVQIAIAMTCPKNPVGVVAGNMDFSDESEAQVLGATGFEPAEMTVEENEKIENLMKKLGF